MCQRKRGNRILVVGHVRNRFFINIIRPFRGGGGGGGGGEVSRGGGGGCSWTATGRRRMRSL